MKYSILVAILVFLHLTTAGVAQIRSEDWQPVAVPGTTTFSGYAWYKTWFKPHDSFFINHQRDLYGESVIFNIRGLAGAHAVYINRKKIGSGGAFPPDFKDGSRGNHRHKIPSGLLVRDQWNEVAIRVYHESDEGGFLTEAPFVMTYFQELVFEGTWKFRIGDDSSWLGGPLHDRPDGSSFDEFHESSRVLGEAETLYTGEKLSPEASFEKMQAADDLVVELMLAEPLVAQPTHFSFDSRGRLWVAQYRQYPYPAGLKMISRDRYYRSHYDKLPPPPPDHDRGRDRISIHEDTDGDGRYDKHRVFQDGLNMANAAVRGRGGVWVMHTPYLLFYPDADFDDVPDGPPVVHLQGFGMEDSHSVANGLVWGMDGWLYGAQGSTTSCHVTRPEIDPANAPGVYFQGCMVWRYHPESHRFEVFAEGGGNNFGLEVDSGGRIFTGNNGGQTRGWHYMQGGMHLMQGTTPNKFGPPRNPFAFGELPKMATEQEIPRFTHFATLVESTALPSKYQRSFFSVEPLHNFVIASRRIPIGATFKTSDIGKVLTSDDFAFRPVYIGNAPDGSILVADFYEHYIAHGQHYQSQIDPSTGRIFRLRGRSERLETNLDLYSKSTDELIELLNHPNRWHRHTAVRLLGERKDENSKEPLKSLVATGEDLESLAALWALYQGFGIDDQTALIAMRHAYPPVRYWAVRLICDDIGFANKRTQMGLADSLGGLAGSPNRLPGTLFNALLDQAGYEADAEVRSQMAGSARRLPVDQALPLVSVLLRHDEDIDDPYIPLLCWWVLEANLDRDQDAVLSLFDDPRLRSEPMVVGHILQRVMRALALKGKNQDLRGCAKLLAQVNSDDQLDQLLQGFQLAYAGRMMTGLPKELANRLVESGRSSLELRLRLGDDAAEAEAIALLADPTADIESRIAVARTLGETQSAGSLSALLASLASQEPRLQKASLTALSGFDDPRVPDTLLTGYERFSDDVLTAFYDVMLSRDRWASALLDQIENGTIKDTDVPRDVREQLVRYPHPEIAARTAELFALSKPDQPQNDEHAVAALRELLSDGTGNPYAGEAAFMKRCATCHKLFHKGGQIGPDLTPYQRGDLQTLLTSIINPSAEIREGFQYVTLLTVDGRILSGFVIDQDTQIMTLRGKSGTDIRIDRDDVEEIQPVGRSLMPDGLLDGMTEQELRDFFAYLRISQPITP